MMQTLGASLTHVAPGEVHITSPVSSNALQQHGFAHAALTFALGDSAAGYSALSTLGEDHEVVTAEMKINLLAPGRGTGLLAKGRVIKPGRRLIVVTSEVFAMGPDGSEPVQIALLQGTVVPVPASGG